MSRQSTTDAFFLEQKQKSQIKSEIVSEFLVYICLLYLIDLKIAIYITLIYFRDQAIMRTEKNQPQCLYLIRSRNLGKAIPRYLV